MITQTINLNLIPGGVLPRINVSQYDKGARTLQFNLYNGVTPFTIPDGSSVYVVGTKADKTGFDYEATYTGGLVSIDVTEQMTAFAGDVEIEIRIINSGEQIATGNFILCVERTALADDTVISETDIPIIQHLPELVAETEENAELAHKWATFGDESEEPSATNNAKYWAEQAAQTDIGQVQNQLNNITGELNVRNHANCTATTSTISGVTYTVNSDKTISATWSATPTGTAMLIYSNSLNLTSGKEYKLSGCPSNGGWSTGNFKYRAYVRNITDNATVASDIGSGASFIPVSGKNYGLYIDIGVNAGSSGSLTFKPMIRSASDPDPTYVPYAMTNRELTEEVSAIDGKTSSLISAEGFFHGWQRSFLLGNVAKTYIKITDTTYKTFRLDIFFGPIAKYGVFYLFNQNDQSVIRKKIAGDIEVGTDILIELDGSAIVVKNPSYTGGVGGCVTALNNNYQYVFSMGSYE